MLTAANIAKIQSALDTLAAIPSARLATTSAATVPLLDLHIKCYYCASREYTDIGARKITRKVAPAHYYAVCEIDGLDVSATGATRAAALRNLFKALHNCALLNEPTLLVPLALREPTKAKAMARAERKAVREQEAARKMVTEQRWLDAQAMRAATIIVAAAHGSAVEAEETPVLLPCSTYSSGRYVAAAIVPAGAEAGTEGTFNALLGLRTEQKIVALANALQHAGVTIHRVDEDGAPIIRASTPDRGTATVLNL